MNCEKCGHHDMAHHERGCEVTGCACLLRVLSVRQAAEQVIWKLYRNEQQPDETFAPAKIDRKDAVIRELITAIRRAAYCEYAGIDRE